MTADLDLVDFLDEDFVFYRTDFDDVGVLQVGLDCLGYPVFDDLYVSAGVREGYHVLHDLVEHEPVVHGVTLIVRSFDVSFFFEFVSENFQVRGFDHRHPA